MSKRKRNEQLMEEQEKQAELIAKNQKWLKEVKQKHKKKKQNHTYQDFIGVDIDFPFLQPIDKWKRKSNNKERQLEEFIKYAFFKYEVPTWAMNMMKLYIDKNLKEINNDNVAGLTLQSTSIRGLNPNHWDLKSKTAFCVSNEEIMKVAMSGKGYKELLSHMFTKKEIHSIVTSKEETLERALMRAKIQTYTNNESLIEFFLDRSEFKGCIKGSDSIWGSAYSITRIENDEKIETDEEFHLRKKTHYEKTMQKDKYFRLMVYLLKHNLSSNDCQEIFDFFRTTALYSENNLRAVRSDLPRGSFLYVNEEVIMLDDFFKRSIGTVIAMSNEWHLERENARTTKMKVPQSWDKKYDDYIMGRYKVEELDTANKLSSEGKSMGHCVGSYAYRCGRGECNILSLKKDDGRLLTMEVVKDKIVQVKGKHNRRPNENEIDVVRNIANFYNLSVSGVL